MLGDTNSTTIQLSYQFWRSADFEKLFFALLC